MEWPESARVARACLGAAPKFGTYKRGVALPPPPRNSAADAGRRTLCTVQSGSNTWRRRRAARRQAGRRHAARHSACISRRRCHRTALPSTPPVPRATEASESPRRHSPQACARGRHCACLAKGRARCSIQPGSAQGPVPSRGIGTWHRITGVKLSACGTRQFEYERAAAGALPYPAAARTAGATALGRCVADATSGCHGSSYEYLS